MKRKYVGITLLVAFLILFLVIPFLPDLTEPEPGAFQRVEPTVEVADPPPESIKQPEAPAVEEKQAAGGPSLPKVSIGPGWWAPKTHWAVDVSQSTMAEVLRRRALEPTRVGVGLDLVGVALTEDSDAPLAGVYVHGDYAYVGGMSVGHETSTNLGIRILDISDPTSPVLVSRIPLRDREPFNYIRSVGDAVATRVESDAFHGDVAIVLNGVPDTYDPDEYPWPYGVWDVTEPGDPHLLGVVNPGSSTLATGWAVGDKPYDSKAVAGSYFFTLYARAETRKDCMREEWWRPGQSPDCSRPDDHLAVVDLSDPRNPVVVGDWHDSGLLGTLRGLSVNKAGTLAYVVSIGPPPFGSAGKEIILYILDIRDRTLPSEIARFVYPYPGPWAHSPYAVPNEDDTLVILADGRWAVEECTGYGRLHILDISDLSAIHEVGVFKIAESDDCFSGRRTAPLFQATDIAVKGDLVYSTWLRGGLHVADISDPSNPVEVGAFRSPDGIGPWLSDVALYGDYALATTVWWSGLYVVRPTAAAQAD